MVGLGRKGQIELECPFCHGSRVRVFHKESYLQGKKSHIAAGDKTKFYRKPDTYEVLEDCPNCRKTAREIQRAYETGIVREPSREERLERMRRAGLPTRIEYGA